MLNKLQFVRCQNINEQVVLLKPEIEIWNLIKNRKSSTLF